MDDKCLSHHDCIAEFVEIKHIPCRFKTSLCPDKCDHASTIATFKVIEYKDFVKEGEYGDEKQEIIRCDVQKPVYGQDPSIAETCKSLQKGQKVHIVYDHLYVKTGVCQHPERPVKLLELI